MSFSVTMDRPSKATTLLSEEPYAGDFGGDVELLQRQLEEVRRHYRFPVSRQPFDAAQRFNELCQTWREGTRGVSIVEKMVLHPAYQQIIGMGSPALPLILREMETKGGHWFWALRSITSADPVQPAQRGKVAEMRQAWLTWARGQGIAW